MWGFFKERNTIVLTPVGIHKSHYREMKQVGIIFKLDKAEINWKNFKELNEEQIIMGCAESRPIGIARN